MSQVSEPKFKVVASHGNIEIREYDPILVAQVKVGGERKNAISEGFKILADYIFGNNVSRQKINMTAPVIQQESKDGGYWHIRFVMPFEYLPRPNNSQIELLAVLAKCYAVIRFSGLASQDSLQKHLERLRKYVKVEKIHPTGDPIFAFYNPPWTMPFLRRNEIMIEVKK
jgi:DNA gyrase inhibitor GyrI